MEQKEFAYDLSSYKYSDTKVHKLNGFAMFLDKEHSEWKYFNVYDRRTRQYLKRFYKGNLIPDFLSKNSMS